MEENKVVDIKKEKPSKEERKAKRKEIAIKAGKFVVGGLAFAGGVLLALIAIGMADDSGSKLSASTDEIVDDHAEVLTDEVVEETAE